MNTYVLWWFVISVVVGITACIVDALDLNVGMLLCGMVVLSGLVVVINALYYLL
jgi:hypothetical protein